MEYGFQPRPNDQLFDVNKNCDQLFDVNKNCTTSIAINLQSGINSYVHGHAHPHMSVFSSMAHVEIDDVLLFDYPTGYYVDV